MKVKIKLKFIGSIVLTCGILSIVPLIVYFTERHNWSYKETVTGVVHATGIQNGPTGSQPFFIIDLESGKHVRVRSQHMSPYVKGDKVLIRVFKCSNNSSHKRYSLKR